MCEEEKRSKIQIYGKQIVWCVAHEIVTSIKWSQDETERKWKKNMCLNLFLTISTDNRNK